MDKARSRAVSSGSASPTTASFSSVDIDDTRSLLNRFYYPLAVGAPEGAEGFRFNAEVIKLGPLTVGQLGFGAPVTLVGPVIPSALGGLGHSWSPDGRTLLVAVWPRVGEPSSWSVDVETGAATALEGPVIDLPAWQRLAP